MNESPAWLLMLADAAARQSSMGAIQTAEAVLAGTAVCQSKEGRKVFSDITNAFAKQAGI